MFGRDTRGRLVRGNSWTPGMPDADGGADPTSSAYSPLVTIDLEPVRFSRPRQTQPDNPSVQSLRGSGDWDDYTTRSGVREYVNQSVGGQPGQGNTLGYSFGLRPRRELSPFLTGRVIAFKPMGVGPSIGQVGRDNRANRLFAAVASQQTDYTPQSSAEVAEQFTGKGFNFS